MTAADGAASSPCRMEFTAMTQPSLLATPPATGEIEEITAEDGKNVPRTSSRFATPSRTSFERCALSFDGRSSPTTRARTPQ